MMPSNGLRSNPSALSRRDEPGAGADRRTAPLSTREAATALGVSEQAVRQAIARGTLAAGKRGRAYRIRQDELDRYARRRLERRPAEPRGTVVALPPPVVVPALPTPATRFVGREAELAALIARLADPAERVVTVTGPGGIGKTRLALAAAAIARDRFPDGVSFVDLASLARPHAVIPTIAQTLGLREQTGRDSRAQLAAFLQGKRFLLVLDNFEQILEAAPDVAWVVARAPDLTVLVTSRAPLRIGGERVLPVPPLSLPVGHSDIAALLASDAGRLFVERAREHDPGFAVHDAAAPIIADICTRLDGLPLAIELAAARSNVLPPPQMRDRLERRLPFLTRGARDAPARQSAMRSAIAWSYDLLAAPEQQGFRRLAVFAGGCTLEAAAAVLRVDDASSTEVLDLIDTLVSQSLMARAPGPGGVPRFRMLETIQEYGLERLEADEETDARSAHARYFLRFAQALRPLSNTRSTITPHDRLAADDANLRAALLWLTDRGRHPDVATFVAACWVYWYASGQLREAEGWLTRALRRLDEASEIDRARLSIARAELLMLRGEAAGAESAFATALPLMRMAGNPFDLAMALIAYGASLNNGGKYADAERLLHEASSLAESIEDPELRAATAGRAQSNLSNSARGLSDPKVAAARSEHALRWFRGWHFDLAESRALVDLADTVRDLGDHRAAAEHYQMSIARIGERGEPRHLSDALTGIACCATAWGQHRTALLLFGAADALRERIGVGMMLPIDAVLVDRDRAAVRENVADLEFETGSAQGRALSLAEAIALAMAVAPHGSDPPIFAAPPKPLTRREREILGLLAESRTDREIGEALFLSPRTVNWHVRGILAKLGAHSRQDAVAQANFAGLLTDRSAATTSQ